MRLIESKAELLPWNPGIEGVYKTIELAGRCCYKSEDKMTEDSAKAFVDRMIASNHTAMLEHGTVYLMVHTIAPEDWDKKIGRHKLLTIDDCRDDLRTNPTYNKNGEENWWAKEAGHKANVMAVKYADNPYSKVKIVLTKHELNTKGGIILTPTGDMPVIRRGTGKVISIFNTILITTNYRVLVENNWLDDLKYLCDPTEFHEMRYSFKLTTSIGVTRELNRHRVHSIAEQSTRYCNYSKDKFENEIKFVKPAWLPLNLGVYKVEKKDEGIGDIVGDGYIKEVSNEDADNQFLAACLNQEIAYMNLVTENGWHQQQAREVLPLCTATEIVHTAFAEDWMKFFNLRYFETTGKVHPNMKELTEKMWKVCEENGILQDILSYKQ